VWAHRTYEAHWSLRLLYLVVGTMALQNSAFACAAAHRAHHLYVDDVTAIRIGAARVSGSSNHRLDAARVPESKPDFSNIPDLRLDPMRRSATAYYVRSRWRPT